MGKLKRILTERLERERLAAQGKRAAEIRARQIEGHRKAIEGAEAQRDLMGDAWADRVIAYRRRMLAALDAE